MSFEWVEAVSYGQLFRQQPARAESSEVEPPVIDQSPSFAPPLAESPASNSGRQEESLEGRIIEANILKASGETPKSYFHPPSSSSPSDDLLIEKAAASNAVISQIDVRGKKGRRLTFRMQEVPDVVVKGKGDRFVEEARAVCGSNILGVDDESADEAWEPRRLADEYPGIGGLTDAEAEEHLMAELLAANDETDALLKLDSLGEGKKLKDLLNGPLEDAKKVDRVNGEIISEEQPPLESRPEEDVVPKAVMDMTQLRLWFDRVRRSYQQEVKVIKVNANGTKLVRVIKVDESFFSLSRGGSLAPRICHLSAIKQVRLGFVSDAFFKLLDVTPESELVPPPQICAVVHLPNNTLSLIFPSEQARNEFLLLMRVVIKRAKSLFGDNSAGQVEQQIVL